MTIGSGTKPYFSSRKPLTSNQLSSDERNLEGALVAPDESVTFVCAQTFCVHKAKAIAIFKLHEAINKERLKCRVALEAGTLRKGNSVTYACG